jgi:hypothetical protein
VGEGLDHDVHLCVDKGGGVHLYRKVQGGSLDAMDDRRWCSVQMQCRCKSGNLTDLGGIFDERCFELCQRELEWEFTVVTGMFVAFN